jgi:hypothetical protein
MYKACEVVVAYVGSMYSDDHGKEYSCGSDSKYFVSDGEDYQKYACGKHLTKAVDGTTMPVTVARIA